MKAMNITQAAGSTPYLPSTAALPTPDQAAQFREVAQAVQRLNDSLALPDNRELTMSIDPKTKIPVVRVLDASTHEVLDQFPAEYVLRVTAFLETEAAQESLSKNPALGR